VATDGSQKIVQRLLNPIRDRIRLGQSFDGLALAVAGWMAYLLAAAPAFGSRWRASDPWAGKIAEIGEATPHDLDAIVAAIVGITPIFGNDLDTPHFRTVVSRGLRGFLNR
jgi:fructuronate reductase